MKDDVTKHPRAPLNAHERARLLALLKAHGRSVVSFQSLEPALHVRWEREGAVVYFDTGSAWIGAGDPLADIHAARAIARRFGDDAIAQGRRFSFFCCESPNELDGVAVALGEQPIWIPSRWSDTLSSHRRLREQIRRARAKGVRVRRVRADELDIGTALRTRVDALCSAWLGTRPMEPLQFLVTLAPFEMPEEHFYYVAERNDDLVAFLSAVPIYGRKGVFFEDLVRSTRAPNGTTELTFDVAMREAAERGDAMVTSGLAPLSGDLGVVLRTLGILGRGLYDFAGVRAFKARLHPDRWERVWMVHDARVSSIVAMIDALRAFAGGSLVSFGARTLVRRPLLAAWLLTLLLAPWTMFLALLATFSNLRVLSYDRDELVTWVLFDAIFFFVLVRAFARPRTFNYAALALLAACDGALAIRHFMMLGIGDTPFTILLRPLATFAPVAASLALARCALHVHRSARARRARTSSASRA